MPEEEEEEYSSKGMSVQQNYILRAYFHVYHFSRSFQRGFIAFFSVQLLSAQLQDTHL